MGANTFSVFIHGTNADDAFRAAHDDATYERGHGGYSGTIAEKGTYTLITTTPMTEAEATAHANALLAADDPRISDKWGPAGAIPVKTDSYTTQITDLAVPFTGRESADALIALFTPHIPLAKGQRLIKVRVTGWVEPKRPYGQFVGNRVASSVEATIAYPDATVDHTLKVDFTAAEDLDYDKVNDAAIAALGTKIRPNDTVTSVRITGRTAATKVQANAPTGKTVTRYIVTGTPHRTWQTGFPTQAAARAYAVEYLTNKTDETWDRVESAVEIESVTRREDGAPLVQVTRTVKKVHYSATVTLSRPPANPTNRPANAWLFFGWASM
jgi:hypothetical protein